MGVVPFDGLLLAVSVELGLCSHPNMQAEANYLDFMFQNSQYISHFYLLNRLLVY